MTRRSKSYFSSVNPPPLQKLSKTHFHKKGFALSLVLKVRVFGIRKWPVACENVKAKPVILNILQSTSVFIAAEKKGRLEAISRWSSQNWQELLVAFHADVLSGS